MKMIRKISLILTTCVFLLITINTSHEITFTKECEGWIKPIKSGKLIKEFDPPDEKWLAGHRGVDYLSEENETIYAPANGTISFSGVVANKPVVTIDHGVLKSTFEPAISDKKVGQEVKKGEEFANVSFGSDKSNSHCSIEKCLHWGVKNGDNYVNPLSKLNCCPIILVE